MLLTYSMMIVHKLSGPWRPTFCVFLEHFLFHGKKILSKDFCEESLGYFCHSTFDISSFPFYSDSTSNDKVHKSSPFLSAEDFKSIFIKTNLLMRLCGLTIRLQVEPRNSVLCQSNTTQVLAFPCLSEETDEDMAINIQVQPIIAIVISAGLHASLMSKFHNFCKKTQIHS